MTPRILIDTAQVPGGEELRLFARGDDHMIVLERNELMNSRMSGSEEALAQMTIERLENGREANILIGGYGMGFTLRKALAHLGVKGHVTVAELMPQIIAWAKGPMAKLTDSCLDDPRVSLRMGDVADAIAEASARYDAILLDVDNGPDGLIRQENDGLYTPKGLSAAKRALKPGGIVAIWSAAPDKPFAKRLERAGFAVDEVAVRARQNGKGPRHVIWFAKKS